MARRQHARKSAPDSWNGRKLISEGCWVVHFLTSQICSGKDKVSDTLAEDSVGDRLLDTGYATQMIRHLFLPRRRSWNAKELKALPCPNRLLGIRCRRLYGCFERLRLAEEACASAARLPDGKAPCRPGRNYTITSSQSTGTHQDQGN